MACGGRLRRLQPHPFSFPPRSRCCSQSSHHAVSSSPACRHTPPCIRPPTVLRRPCLLDVVLGHDIQKVEGEALLGACLRARGMSPRRRFRIAHLPRACLPRLRGAGVAKSTRSHTGCCLQKCTSLRTSVFARLARPCLSRLRESWTCAGGTRPPRASTPAPALSPAVLGRPLDAVARRRGPRLRPVRADPDLVNSRSVVPCGPARPLRRARDQRRHPCRGQSTGRSR